ncbi:MAG: flagellar hook-length control protein FliK [Sedimentisphaerales bacterium]|jgi:flagellar hook-length control protein FliK
MNINLTTIVALSASSTQSAGGHSANKAGRSDDATATSAGDNQVASDTATNRTGYTDNEVSEKTSTASSTKESQASQSNDTQTKVTDKTGGKTSSDFNKVLKKRLKQDEAETDQDAEQDTIQSQTSVANDTSQTAQACSLPVIQVEVATPEQQQPAEDVSTSIEPTQIIPQTDQSAVQINQTDSQTSQSASQTDQTTTQTSQPVSRLPVQAVSVSLPQTQTVDNGVQVALQDTQGQVVQLDALQQTQISVSDEAQTKTQVQAQNLTNTAQATEPTTQQMPQISVINQSQDQWQPAEDVSTSIEPTQIIPQTNQPTVQINQTDLQASRSASQTDQTTIQTSQTVSQIPVQAVSISLPPTQTVDNSVQTASQNTQGQVIQWDALPQTQIAVLDEAQAKTQVQAQNLTNTPQVTEPTTPQMPQIPVINQGQEQQQQGQEQTQPVPVQMTSTSTVNNQDVAGTTQKSTANDTVKSDVPVKSSQTDSGTPAVTSNQDKIDFNANAVLTYSANQAVSEQPKAQSVDLTSTIIHQNSDVSYVATTTTTVGQQTGKETTTRYNAQNRSGGNQQDNPLLTTDSRATLSTVNGLAGEFNKAGIEKVSLENTVSQPQSKSQTDSLSVQSLGLQAMTTTTTTGHVTDAQPVIASHSAATTNNTSAQDTTASLREQICMSVQNSVQQGQRQITINLNPPELGRVSIKFTEQSGQLTGSLEVTNSQTRADIQQAMPEMLHSLEQSGISIKRIDVSLSDISGQSSHDFSRESASQNQWGQLAQQGFDNTNGGRFYQDSYVASSRFSGTSEFGGDTGYDWNQSSSSENLLNVLI